eukprot:g1608.t1
MVRRRVQRSCAILVASAAVAGAGVIVGGGPGPARYAGSDPETSTYTTTWDSSPFNLESVTDNNLGLMAKACSEQFCHAGIDGLDLWVSLEEVCTVKSQPYFATILEEESPAVSGALSTGDWHPVSAGVLCGFIGAASMVAGFKLGANFHGYNRGILHH